MQLQRNEQLNSQGKSTKTVASRDFQRDSSQKHVATHRPIDTVMARRNSGLKKPSVGLKPIEATGGGLRTPHLVDDKSSMALLDRKAQTKLKQTLVQTILNVNRLQFSNRRASAADLIQIEGRQNEDAIL